MAPSRAYSFPLSHSEEISRHSPFTIDPSNAAYLTSCKAFRSIQDLLGCRDNNLFCDFHSDINPVQQEAWLLQRDVTFALVFPLLDVHRKATAIALSMLGDRNIFDMELVFRGEARGAYSWLTCVTTVEQSWCMAEGCCACNVSYILQSEPIIRLCITACHLASRILHPRDSPSNLPILDFWTQTLHRALQEDKFWGRDSWTRLGERAKGLEDGIFAMAQQCCELESIANVKDTERNSDTAATATQLHKRTPRRALNSDCTPKESWVRSIVLGCWTTLQADAIHAKAQQESLLVAPTGSHCEPSTPSSGQQREGESPPRPVSASL